MLVMACSRNAAHGYMGGSQGMADRQATCRQALSNQDRCGALLLTHGGGPPLPAPDKSWPES